MINWNRNRRAKRNQEIAEAVRRELTGPQSWEKFLPPVALRDTIYMVTENGSVYALHRDDSSGMEVITTIRRG